MFGYMQYPVLPVIIKYSSYGLILILVWIVLCTYFVQSRPQMWHFIKWQCIFQRGSYIIVLADMAVRAHIHLQWVSHCMHHSYKVYTYAKWCGRTCSFLWAIVKLYWKHAYVFDHCPQTFGQDPCTVRTVSYRIDTQYSIVSPGTSWWKCAS